MRKGTGGSAELQPWPWLKRLPKKSQSSAPRGLKSARRIENKGLDGTPEAVPLQGYRRATLTVKVL